MNIVLWVLQIALGLYYLAGGIYMAKSSSLPGGWLRILPKAVWTGLGVLQILFAIGLVVPDFSHGSRFLVPIAAIGVALETVFVCAVTGKFARFKDARWVVLPAILAGFVAYGRIVLIP